LGRKGGHKAKCKGSQKTKRDKTKRGGGGKGNVQNYVIPSKRIVWGGGNHQGEVRIKQVWGKKRGEGGKKRKTKSHRSKDIVATLEGGKETESRNPWTFNHET